MGPYTEFSNYLHGEKYRERGEDFRAAMNRVANALKDNDEHYHEFRDIILHQRFLPAGRIQSAVGSIRQTTPYNCLGGETEILTSTGFVRLMDIVGKTVEVLSPVSGDLEPATGKSYGKQRLYRIEISNSRFGQDRAGSFFVRATANHRWVLRDGSVTTELKVGDVLSAAGFSKIDLSPIGWVHGFIYGDGTKQRDGKFLVRLCGKKARHLERFLPFTDRITYPQSNEGDPNVVVYSDDDLKALPKDGTDLPYLRGFVEGLLAADGCFKGRIGDAFQFHGNKETVEWVRDHLTLVGYVPSGRAHDTGSTATNFGERSEQLWKQDFRTEADHKGFRVKAITPLEEEEVFCVEEPKFRQIILRNGLRTGQCYVSGTIADSYVDDDGNIMDRAKEAAKTMRMGGGIGYDFSTLRPRGTEIKKLQSHSSGPISFMEIFNAVCLATSSSGHRRGAQMGVMRVDHPDIMEFIHAKQNRDKLTGFNISVAVTDEFMRAVSNGKSFSLRWGGYSYASVDAAELWDTIMRSTWDWAEPGVLFIDRINEMNNLYYCETIAATNPCGEQPLPPYGACLLGSFNLVKYLRESAGPRNPNLPAYYFDYAAFKADIPYVVRAMDNVVDYARYPLDQQRVEAFSKRRMGLGITGLANAAEACGHPYGSPGFLVWEEDILTILKNETYRASALIARDKGPFPLFDKELYLNGNFVKTLDPDVRADIAAFGIRNSHLTSIAPTGTISACADNVSSGLEPVFSYVTHRPINTPTGVREFDIEDYGYKFLNVAGKQSAQVTADEHVSVLAVAQRNVDSAVSKTCNVTGDMPWEDFKGIYEKAWELGAKGCTTFNADGKRMALLTAKKPEENEFAKCEIDPVTGLKECG